MCLVSRLQEAPAVLLPPLLVPHSPARGLKPYHWSFIPSAYVWSTINVETLSRIHTSVGILSELALRKESGKDAMLAKGGWRG